MDSPEDAWAGSCLSKDPDMIDAGWDSLKDVLFDIINAQDGPSTLEIVDSSAGADMDIVHETENKIDRVVEKFAVDFVRSAEVVLEEMFSPAGTAATSNGAEANGIGSEDADAKKKDIFLPTYDESLRTFGLSDPEVDSLFQEFKWEQPSEGIFKIWDLDTPPEENDLIEQLNKALTRNPLDPEPTLSVDSEERVSQDRSVDDLISGISDLTLSPIDLESKLMDMKIEK